MSGRYQPKVSGVYAITNTVNGKLYVGSAKHIGQRWVTHRSALNHGTHYSQHLTRAWRIYGPSAFVFSVLEEVPNIEDLYPREQHWIDTLRPDYNGKSNAIGGPRGREISASHRAHLSAALKGKLKSPEHRAALSAMRKGQSRFPKQSRSEEFREACRQRMTGQKRAPISDWHRARISEACTGRVFSPETLAKMSAAQRRRQQRVRESRITSQVPTQAKLFDD